jgi:hypothetical protein
VGLAAPRAREATVVADGFRIIVRGVMSDRFCRGFAGVSGRPGAGSTILESAPHGPSLPEILRRLENLGLEVVAVEPVRDPARDPEEG